VPPLKADKIDEYRTQVDDRWAIVDEHKKLVREVKLANFMQAVDFVNQVAVIAEAEGHHPNLMIHDYNRVTLELYTHKINGLHENDFILAAKIDKVVAEELYQGEGGA
jgi:4a-hydroxytetrahydrobiopterin dehydratase